MASVLVVDDNEAYRLVLRLVLELEGHRVVEAADAEEAVKVAARELPDAAFVDCRLPGMSGAECIRVLRAVSPGTAVFGLTASSLGDERDELVAAGARSAHVKLDLDGADIVDLVANR